MMVLEAFKKLHRSCLIMGATGAVGKSLVKQLLEYDLYDHVTVLARREFDYDGTNKEKLHVKVIDFEKPDESVFKGHQVFFCCHGTTRAQAGSAEAFRKIDRDYVLKFADIFKMQNKSDDSLQFLLVTSTGADPNSWFLYPKTKGDLEREICKKISTVAIFRPALLMGRPEGRMFEGLAAAITPVIEKLSPRSLSVHVDSVALAMILTSVGIVPDSVKSVTTLWGTEVDNLLVFNNDEIILSSQLHLLNKK